MFLALALTKPGGLSVYRYAASNPLAYTDPDGALKIDVDWKFMGGYLLGVLQATIPGAALLGSPDARDAALERARGMGLLMMGVGEVIVGGIGAVGGTAGGVATSWTGVGAVAGAGVAVGGVALATVGVGNIAAGLAAMSNAKNGSGGADAGAAPTTSRPVASQKLPRYEGPKPRYAVNAAHVPGQRGFNPRKTPLPKDAEQVFENAVPNDAVRPTAWFGRSAKGQIYRFSSGNDGTAHFSGIEGVGDGVRNISRYALERLKELGP